MAKGFFKDMKSELKKVVWPSTRQVINNTLLVVALVIVVSLIVRFPLGVQVYPVTVELPSSEYVAVTTIPVASNFSPSV